MRLFVFLLLSLIVSSGSAQSLEQFLSHPIESNFSSSTNGKYIAWVINDHGKCNVMIRVGSDFPKLFTDYQLDDGQEISQLVFSPNGTKLVFVRGKGSDQSLYVKDVSSKNPPAKITHGHSPVFFPDGLGILFSKGDQIYETNLDINATPKLFFIASGANRNPKFSPNGNDVLFVSDRDDHSFIGVYSLAAKKTRWSASDVSNDDFPVWSPDGKQIAFIRTESLPGKGEENLIRGKKFSIWIADAATMNEKKIWQSPADDGGFAQENSKPLTWTASNRILFFSEHTGWNHIFSMNPDGSDLKDITPGDGEVENFVIDASGQNIYFDGNREDFERRHMWKSNVTIGTPKAVTTGDGIESNPHFSGSDLYCFRSTFNYAKSLVRADEFRKITLPVNFQKPATFSNAYFVKPEKISFPAGDGTTIYGQLFIDRTITGKRVGIVYIHGGPYRQMLSGFHHQEYYNYVYAFNQYLASMGYAVLSVNYRSGIGYGKKFRITDGQRPRNEIEYQDVISAAKFLQLVPEVDKARIGLWGSSYGGYLAALGLARNPELFKAGADLRCLNDWTFEPQDISNGWSITEIGSDIGSSPAELAKWTAPIMFVQGNDSSSVEFQQVTVLAKRLREKKLPAEMFSLPNEIHFNLRYDDWMKVLNAVKDFLDKKLK